MIPSSRRPPHRVPHRDPALRIESRAGLVEEQHLGTMRNRAGDLHPLRQSAGELRRVRVRPFAEVELLQQLLRPLLRLRAREAEVQTVEVDVLVDRAGAVERVELRHNAHRPPRQRRRLHHIHARNVDPARGWQNARGADADGRRLARAVGAEQTVQLALAHAQIDAIYGNDALFALIDLAKALHLDNDCQTSPHSISWLSRDPIIGIQASGTPRRAAVWTGRARVDRHRDRMQARGTA